jgi:2-polyprenyl-6-methoxyphenol hydroxylase-like FAD-dependent oxidoreductase
MSRIVMIGGGVIGLCSSVLLAKDGHDVTVLERDPAPPPDPGEAWTSWERRGVNQFRMLHAFLPGFYNVMRAEAPEITAALAAAGALGLNVIDNIPAELTGGRRPEDAIFDSLTARRPVAEAAIASVVAQTDGITVRRGEAVRGLLTGTPVADGTPHVIGVVTESGEELRADVVIDCGGRRSSLPAMLEAIGGLEPVEEREDCGFIYYGRHFRSSDGSTPAIFGPLLMQYESMSILTLPADNGTWGVGLIASSKDAALRALGDVDVWERVLRGYPLAAHWIEGEPIDDGVAIMAKIEDRHRTFVVDDRPVATGVLALADSWACTNPSVGRGITIGARHARALRDLLRDPPDDPITLSTAWHAATLGSVEPWYRTTLSYDSARHEQVTASIEGRPFEPDAAYEMTMAVSVAALKDPEVMRAYFEIAGALTLPQDVMARPGMFERIIELGSGWRDEQLPGLSRGELLATIGGAS